MRYPVLVLLSVLLADQLALPPTLEQALRRLPGVRLLEPSTDLVGGYSVEELRGFGYWPPWIVRDLDRDGRFDIAAVVVKQSAGGKQFGVIAIHARAPMQVRWVVPFGQEKINGVAKGHEADIVVPLFCIECDSNAWFRWSGQSYESELYAVGERFQLAPSDSRQRLGLFAQASRDSRFVFAVVPCATAVVRRVAGSAKDRWYFVETEGSKPTRGWIPAAFVSGEGC